MEEEIKKTVEALKKGDSILYPTDTIWGLGCDATNTKAVQKVFKIKKRVEKKSMIVLLDNVKNLWKYVKTVPEIAFDLIANIKKPLTIIYPGAQNLAKNVIAGDNTIAIRITTDEFCRKVIEQFGKPIVSSSANISGEPFPITFNQISESIKKEVDFVVNYHQKRIKQTKASTIIKLEINGEFTVIRE